MNTGNDKRPSSFAKHICNDFVEMLLSLIIMWHIFAEFGLLCSAGSARDSYTKFWPMESVYNSELDQKVA